MYDEPMYGILSRYKIYNGLMVLYKKLMLLI